VARVCPRERFFSSCADQARRYHGTDQKQVAVINNAVVS
jgi:hypothetical protein